MATSREHIQRAIQDFEKTIAHLKTEFSKLQIGRATPALVEDLKIEAYGSLQLLKAVASISIPEPKTICIQPWDKSNIALIEKAIYASQLGLAPTNNGVSVIITLPPLTEERRLELVKVVFKLAEEARITIRNVRQVAHTAFKTMENSKEIGEDERVRSEKELQVKVDEYNKKVDEAAKAKEADIMKI